MRSKFFLTVTLLLTFAAAAAAQNRIKLFDPINISVSDPVVIWNAVPWGSYREASVYLSCQPGQAPTSWLTGPNDGAFVVDNLVTINGRNACGGFCFAAGGYSLSFVGQPVEAAYIPVGPFNEDALITRSGVYTFNLLDLGYTYGSTAVYLNTSCDITPIDVTAPQDDGTGVICHRNKGSRGQRTLIVDSNSVQAHLAHGDTMGACEQ